MKVVRPDLNGVRLKVICSISGMRNGNAPMPIRNSEPPTMALRNSGNRNSAGSRMGNFARLAWRR